MCVIFWETFSGLYFTKLEQKTALKFGKTQFKAL